MRGLMNNREWLTFLVVAVGTFLIASSAQADPGVGVNLGRIEVQERLKPGGRYELPALGVFNPGDEPGDYELTITYSSDDTQSRPPESWFSFAPQRFFLAAGNGAAVDISLSVPTSADPGRYFAYIEARPVAKLAEANVGIAAGTRLSFEVEPSSWLDAQRRRFERWYDDNLPWTFLVPVGALAIAAFMAASKKLRFRLPFEPR